MAYQKPTNLQLYEDIEFFEKWDKLWMLSKQKNKPIYKTPARRQEALWRVPIGDIVEDGQDILSQRRAKASLAIEYYQWRRTWELYQAIDCDITVPCWADCVDEAKDKKVTEWISHASGADGGYCYHKAMQQMTGRRLYLTEQGYMGMGPSSMQPGDMVVVFPGARIPFVLRPTGEDNTFTYVGDVYCDGIMDGEITLRKERQDFFLV
ncbi:hypothetical protein B0T13DRAFT_276689 [Neurospora crassa]|nr:hypothetical protein B0T13DRAFT_276689 [Neurospora crassa]